MSESVNSVQGSQLATFLSKQELFLGEYFDMNTWELIPSQNDSHSNYQSGSSFSQTGDYRDISPRRNINYTQSDCIDFITELLKIPIEEFTDVSSARVMDIRACLAKNNAEDVLDCIRRLNSHLDKDTTVALKVIVFLLMHTYLFVTVQKSAVLAYLVNFASESYEDAAERDFMDSNTITESEEDPRIFWKFMLILNLNCTIDQGMGSYQFLNISGQ